MKESAVTNCLWLTLTLGIQTMAILQVMQLAADTGAMIMMHAENGIAIDVLRDQAFKRGATGSSAGRTRPPELEGEAAHRAIQLASVAGSPLYIVHLSSSNALASCKSSQQWKKRFAETCPQYLYLSLEEHLDQSGVTVFVTYARLPSRSSRWASR